MKAPSAKRIRTLVEQGDMDAKRELARKLMRGKGFHRNEPKAVALLEDCVAIGDTEAMLMLAKYCALGHGMEHDAERAESLICEAANKGNDEAQCLMELINNLKGKESIGMSCLFRDNLKLISPMTRLLLNSVCNKGDRTIERICLLMNIIPCEEISLKGQGWQYFIVNNVKKTMQFHFCVGPMTPIDNKIGNGKTTLLCEALKTNTTLIKLDIGSKHKKRNTRRKRCTSTIHVFHSHQINRQQD